VQPRQDNTGAVLPAAAESVEDVPLWYHTLELPGGVITPGWFDLRGIVDQLPWPDVRGKRCLDVGTYDGFFAFELERRGAREVIATDIGGHDDWDVPIAARASTAHTLSELTGEKGLGFEVARRALGSSVEKRIVNVYDLSPELLGSFDVVVCGSLMLHLRDPVRALEAIRSVCSGRFMSLEEISLPLTIRFRRRAVAEMRLDERLGQWWVANAAGHARMVRAAGFEVLEQVGPFAEPFGVSHPPLGRTPVSRVRHFIRRALTGGVGVPHSALLSQPIG
jgi:tRNA (mo5U34)-methyltransferase